MDLGRNLHVFVVTTINAKNVYILKVLSSVYGMDFFYRYLRSFAVTAVKGKKIKLWIVAPNLRLADFSKAVNRRSLLISEPSLSKQFVYLAWPIFHKKMKRNLNRWSYNFSKKLKIVLFYFEFLWKCFCYNCGVMSFCQRVISSTLEVPGLRTNLVKLEARINVVRAKV